MANNLNEYLGEEEYTKFNKYIDYCNKYLRKKGYKRSEYKKAYRDCLLLLDGKQVKERTLFTICNWLILGNTDIRLYSQDSDFYNWKNVNWQLVSYAETEIRYNRETETVRVLNQKEGPTFTEILNRQTANPCNPLADFAAY